ncbi:fatty acyl-CoA synthetase [Conexibacter sp. JD483]|uniref:fatty acyl-CoA synthetase n=1 Tax=unclassified Conexibacter TaxID=2627773 RepID=UPI002726CD3B|nr:MULTISPECIES: fatty acyl-CoA synthetase [unclassified Conexibacter]MDO8187327.1 fatty acyl-CoA synthetase [Conexibacter sp. CPCC 205706]MDO8200540.1 fatty acyl-CoA synthetase [Conexibacter sp. CPCC 205762]MDR9369991.1 fatty acyl-CoA synthetase [Conexibacter sp. JD483]
MSIEETVGSARRQSLADLLRRSAARHPARVAVSEGARARTFAELDADASRIAQALHARGVGAGDRVALLARNCLDYVQAIFGVARAGAVLVPVNFMLGGREAGYVLGHSRAVALIAQEALVGVAEEALATRAEAAPASGAEASPAMRARVVIGDGEPAEGWEPFSALLAHDDARDPQVPLAPDAPAQVLYTSGTESRPKGAVLSHDALIAQYASCVIDGGMSGDDVELHALPLFHCAQQHCFLVPDVWLGARSIILPGPDPATVLERIEADGVTKLFAPPTVWISLLRHPDFDRRDLSSLRKGYYGAAIMPVEVLRELGERLPQVRLWNFYGQTEMAPVAVMLQPEDQIRKAGSAGRAALNVETRVIRPDGSDCAAGEIGEIVHRSPHAILGYLDDPDKTAAAFAGGWFHSGDLGTLDDEGYLTVVDRIKDMIKTGGENVASREVEEALYEHDAVAEVAVVGVPHPVWIEAVVAIAVPRAGAALDADALIAHARERLAPFKVPKAVAVVDALPKNPSGKLLKRDLREQYAALADEIAR